MDRVPAVLVVMNECRDSVEKEISVMTESCGVY